MSARQPDQRGLVQVIPRFPALKDWIEPVDVGLRSSPRPYDVDDDALIAAIRSVDGMVAIGFKPEDAPSVRSTGVIPGISREQALAGRDVVERLGAEIVRSYRNSSTVIARIPPELGPAIRSLPLVNYIDIIHERRRAGTVVAQADPQPQDTTWGHFKVGAHRAWKKGHVGSGSFVTILDGGVDSLHMFSLYGDANDNGFVCAYDEVVFDSCWDENSNGHGSLVHSVALSLDNSWGYIGVANEPRGNAMVKVCDATSCVTESIAGGLDWAIDMGEPQQVLNMSIFGDEPDDLELEYVERAAAAGILLVGAAGNIYPPADTIFLSGRISGGDGRIGH